MEGVRLRRAMELFKRACVLDAAGRSALLDAECASDMELRGRVEALLAEDSRSMSLLDAPGGGVPMLARQIASLGATAAGAAARVDRAPLPVLTGDYRIIRVIGEGGMGTVYEAEQAIPRRRVALKAIREGLTSPQLVRRFEHEAHMLGRLHHPGIAQIYEAGAADADHPHLAFIAMEYVSGAPLTDHADTARLTIRERVELVVKACDAVHHAHQRGVIHRDLKPTNILVDESGQPKILDFGVARAIDDAEAAMTTMHTMAGQLVGTIAYMSPEQVSGNPDEVDLRSDVYALGVILHRLLTGRLPYDLSRGAIPEIARIIRESEPEKLGTINRALRGDLETIVAKALEKDKERRYQSAAELAEDLRSWLAGAPIAARRDSTLYVLRKNLRRYKAAAMAALVVLLVSVGASVALLRLSRESQRQADLAVAAQAKAQDAETQQRQEAQRARVEARRATAIAGFLEQTLRAGDPNVAQGRERTVLDALQDAAQRVDVDLSEDPPVQASVHQTIGDTYMGLGRFAEAETHYATAANIYEALGAEYAEQLAQVQTFLAGMMEQQGRHEEAEALFRATLEVHRRMYGERHAAIAADLSSLGTVRRQRGDLVEAEALLRDALDMRRGLIAESGDEAGLAATLGRLVGVLTAQERWADAEPYARETLDLALKRNGPRHPNIPLALNNLAAIIEKKGAPEEAEPLYRESLALVREINGPDHVTVSVAELNLAKLLTGRGEYEEAEELFIDCIRIRRAGFGQRHPQLAVPLTNYGHMLMQAARTAEAEPHLRESVDILLAAREVDPSLLPSAEKTLALCLIELDRLEEAEALLLSAHQRLVALRGESHPATADLRTRLAALYDEWGKPAEAARWQSDPPPDHQ